MKYQRTPSEKTTYSNRASTPGTRTVAARLRRVAALLAVGALALTACGNAGEPVSTGSDSGENGIEDAADPEAGDTDNGNSDGGNTDDADSLDRDENGDLEDYEQAIIDGADDPASDFVQPIDEPLDPETAAEWKRLIESDIVAPGDIIDATAWEIDDVIAVSADATEIIVRYTAGNAPCTQSRATVVESDDTIEVSLEVGLHPNVAAMSCLAGTSGSEIVVPLENPVGDRAIVAVQPE